MLTFHSTPEGAVFTSSHLIIIIMIKLMTMNHEGPGAVRTIKAPFRRLLSTSAQRLRGCLIAVAAASRSYRQLTS